MDFHNGMKFSTKGVDNDVDERKSCAQTYNGAWWYSKCHRSNLNGHYLAGYTPSFADGVIWYHFKGHHYSLKTSEMKVRPTA